MSQSSQNPIDNASAKREKRQLVRYLIDVEGLTIWDVRRIFHIKKFIPFFHFKGILLDFRGWE